MNIRKAAVAGQFYGAPAKECREEIEECLPPRDLKIELPESIVAAIVPHAGWVFSGSLAAVAFKAIRQVNGDVDTFVIFGAAHRYYGDRPAVYDSGQWETPLGRIEIDADLSSRIIEQGADADLQAHRSEHSIEVQVPFIQYLFPKAQIVPVVMPITGTEHTFGARIGRLISAINDKKIVCVASTDLTHYGPRYGFCPQGTGPDALRWAREVNDRLFIDTAIRLEAEQLVQIAIDKGNACGPAAAAVVVAAAKAMGRSRGLLFGHTTSHD
ncbi:MAG TPA: AmmeMemoRadiSam system protein B, partial [Anaerohalosphaeraceae bacterium]|nr:AmmeMemoRadiSam system protein B [Anaerohalosphaeraceae bacterium]